MRMIKSFAMAAMFSLVASASGAADVEWIMATGQPDNNYMTRNVREFVKEIEEKSNGRIKIYLHTNGDLIKRASIKRAIQTGQIQLGEIEMPAYGNEDPMYVLDATPGLAPSIEDGQRLFAAQQAYFENLFTAQNIKLLYSAGFPSQGFFVKGTVTNLDDVARQRPRVYSTATLRMAELFGMSGTILPFAEVPQALATGLIDSMYTGAQTGIDTQVWDFTDHYYVVGGGARNVVAVNQAAFGALDDGLKKILVEAAATADKRGFEMLKSSIGDQFATLTENGMNVTSFPETVQAKFGEVGETMLNEWRATASEAANKILDDYLDTPGK